MHSIEMVITDHYELIYTSRLLLVASAAAAAVNDELLIVSRETGITFNNSLSNVSWLVSFFYY